MSAVLVAAALVVATGSIAALASADPRLGLLGLAAALLAAGIIADPLPGPAVLGVRLTAALLAAAVLRASGHAGAPRRRAEEPDAEHRSQLGWPAEALLFAAGAVAGLAVAAGLASFAPVTGTGGTAAGGLLPTTLTSESIALAVAAGIAAISLPAVVAGRGLRRASGAVLVVQAAILARVALGGAPEVLEEIALGVLLVAAAAAAGLLTSAGRAAVVQGLRQA